MATIKQLKIGNTNYDIKALNATNNDQANAVVRDIQYGTAAPSGGSAGQVYLQYSNTTSNNLYIYAEDTIGSQNAVDNYYSKSEINGMFFDAQEITSWRNNWASNGQSYWQKIGNAIYLQVSMRNGTTTDGTVAIALPYAAAANVLVGMQSTNAANGYALITGSDVKIYGVTNTQNVLFSCFYKIAG